MTKLIPPAEMKGILVVLVDSADQLRCKIDRVARTALLSPLSKLGLLWRICRAFFLCNNRLEAGTPLGPAYALLQLCQYRGRYHPNCQLRRQRRHPNTSLQTLRKRGGSALP